MALTEGLSAAMRAITASSSSTGEISLMSIGSPVSSPQGRLLRLTHLRLGLLQPELHAHVAVHRRRRRDVLLGLLALAGAPKELAETEVAVGDEGAHPELLGERERVTVVAVSVLRGIAAGGDLAEQAEGPRLVGTLSALARKGQGSPGEFEGILEPAGEGVCLAQIPEEARPLRAVSYSLNGAQRVLQRRDGVSTSPRQRVGVAQDPRVGH